MQNYSEAIRLDGDNTRGYALRARALGMLGRYEEAIGDWGVVIEGEPGNAMHYYSRGVAYKAIKKYENALFDLNKALRLNPRMLDGYIARAHCLSALDRH